MSKYYTPDITEFHKGFKFECELTQYPDRNNWHTQTFNLDTRSIDLVNDMLYDPNFKDQIRVKFLDEEDILSLDEIEFVVENGGDADKDDDYKLYKSKRRVLGMGTGDDSFLFLSHSNKTKATSIWWLENRGFSVDIFEGYVKNLSELKRLIVQLGLNDNKRLKRVVGENAPQTK